MNSRKKTILFIVSCVFSLFLVEREKNEKIVIDFKSGYVNWLLDTKKETKEASSVTLLTLDDSEESVIQDWPPSPLDYAVILNNLKQGMIRIYLTQIFKNNHLIVKGSLKRFRDFIHIEDVHNCSSFTISSCFRYFITLKPV